MKAEREQVALRATASVVFEYFSGYCERIEADDTYEDLISELAARKNEEDRRKRWDHIREERRSVDGDWDMVDHPSPL